jgi:hypothetical protein
MPKGHYDRTALRRPDPALDITGPVRLLADHGFVTDIDAVYFKRAGAIITNPAEVAVLRERGAPLEKV